MVGVAAKTEMAPKILASSMHYPLGCNVFGLRQTPLGSPSSWNSSQIEVAKLGSTLCHDIHPSAWHSPTSTAVVASGV